MEDYSEVYLKTDVLLICLKKSIWASWNSQSELSCWMIKSAKDLLLSQSLISLSYLKNNEYNLTGQ